MALLPSRASLEDDAAFAAFSCVASGTQSTPWLEEVENYVRARVLRDRDQHVLAFREDDELIAVSAFRKTELELPRPPAVHPAWHLEVLAVTEGRQRGGVGLQVLDRTLSAMREIDSERVFVVAVAHKDNDASIALCAKREITRYMPRGDYWVLVGELTEE